MKPPDPPSGIITPLLTPFSDDEQIDLEALRRVVDHVVWGGVHGIFVLGTTGEFVALDDCERQLVMEKVIEYTAGRVPVWVGVTSCSTKLSQAQSRRVEAAGAQGIVVMPPYYFTLTEPEVEHHICAIGETCRLPLMLYHNAHMGVGTLISPRLVERLYQLDNVVAIKDSSDDLAGFKKVLECTAGSNFSVFQGSEKLLMESLALGAAGGVCSLSNVLPVFFTQLYTYSPAATATDRAKWQEAAMRAYEMYFTGPSLIASVKAAAAYQGICQPLARRPFQALNPVQMKKLERLIEGFATFDPASGTDHLLGHTQHIASDDLPDVDIAISSLYQSHGEKRPIGPLES